MSVGMNTSSAGQNRMSTAVNDCLMNTAQDVSSGSWNAGCSSTLNEAWVR